MPFIEIVFLVTFLVGLIGLLLFSADDKTWKNYIEIVGSLILYFKEKTSNNQLKKDVKNGRSVQKSLD